MIAQFGPSAGISADLNEFIPEAMVNQSHEQHGDSPISSWNRTKQTEWPFLPETERFFTTACFYMIPIAGAIVFLLNILVFVPAVVVLRRSQHRPLHNSNRTSLYYIANLTLSDALLGVDAIFAYVLISDSYDMCILKHACTITLSVTSMTSMLLIGVDRYIYIDHPLHYLQWMTTGRIRGFVAISWLTGLLFGAAPYFWHSSKWEGHCLFAEVMNPVVVLVMGIFYITCILLPLGILYTKIFYCAHFQRKRIALLQPFRSPGRKKASKKTGLMTPKTQSDIHVLFGIHGKFFQRQLSQKRSSSLKELPRKERPHSQTCEQQVTRSPPPALTSRIMQRIHRLSRAMRETRLVSELRSAKMVLLILGTCSCTWLPFVIASFLYISGSCESWCPDLSIATTSTFFFLGLLNSIFDPFIYAWGYKEFPQFWTRTTCGKCKKKPSDSRYRQSLQSNNNILPMLAKLSSEDV